jgi:Protein of unknown function (DUF3307)
VEKIAALLIAAHAVGDFALQPGWLVARRRQLRYLVIHTGIHGIIVYVVLQAWTCWEASVVVFITHTVIDWTKLRLPDETRWFVADQAAHVLVSLVLAGWLVESGLLTSFAGGGYQVLVLLGGFILTVRGAGFLVGKFAQHLAQANQLVLNGLENGGKWIGLFERALIFVLIFVREPAGIGFLVAAKSILRFEEAKDQKLAEYVLIGTLLSFSLGIALSWLTRWAMNL